LNTFIQYAQFYDLLYEDKNYLEEEKYIKQLIDQNSSNVKSILDLGCGTGIHARHFAEDGYNVCGIDLSEDMLQIAKHRKSKLSDEISSRLKYYEGDIRKIRLDEKFDVVTSLFHVLSYQVTNNDVFDVLSTVKFHLKPGGLFIFDFWYGPGVLTELPVEKIKEIKKNNIQFKRIAKPEIKPNENIVKINYTLLSMNEVDDKKNKFVETHIMRYFFKPELELFFLKAGFEMINLEGWMENEAASLHTWNAVVISRLIN